MPEGLYEIDELAGGGSHALVCFGRVRGRGERVALKVLRPQHLGNAALRARFTDEARILLPIHHPDVLRVHRLLDYAGRPVIEMEAVDGVSAEVLLGPGGTGLPLPVAVELVRRTAHALDAVFAGPYGPGGTPMRVVHRDVKPGNLLISRTGHLKVADFGIAKAEFDGRRAKSLFSVPGSPGYVSPERLAMAAPDGPAADVFALGVTLFQLVTGRPLVLPREAEPATEAAVRQLAHLADPALAALVGAMVAHDPEARPSMDEVAVRLADRGHPTELRPWAEQVVAPLVDRRRGRSLAEDFSLVRFLEGELPSDAPPPLSPAETTRAVRRHLAAAGWERRVPDLERIVEASRGGFEPPLLEVLDRARPAWWAPWVTPATPEELAAVLWVLGDHATPAVVARARRLRDHADPRVARAAGFLVDRA